MEQLGPKGRKDLPALTEQLDRKGRKDPKDRKDLPVPMALTELLDRKDPKEIKEIRVTRPPTSPPT